MRDVLGPIVSVIVISATEFIQPLGAIHSGPSFLGLLTRLLTGYNSTSSFGAGLSSGLRIGEFWGHITWNSGDTSLNYYSAAVSFTSMVLFIVRLIGKRHHCRLHCHPLFRRQTLQGTGKLYRLITEIRHLLRAMTGARLEYISTASNKLMKSSLAHFGPKKIWQLQGSERIFG